MTVGSRTPRRRSRRRRCRSTSLPLSRSRQPATRKRHRSSSRSPPRSTSRVRRSPTAPTRCVRQRCAGSGRTRCWCSSTASAGIRAHSVHLNGSIGRGSTGVDLNAIPVSAIEQIEVLRDGAAAQYGSDAIAGVINIVLKGGESRPTISTKFGLSTGSFIGNRCSADGLNCALGDAIDFSDGELFDRGRTWGLPLGKGNAHRRRRVPASQPHQSCFLRSARSDRCRRRRQQRGARSPIIDGAIPTRAT